MSGQCKQKGQVAFDGKSAQTAKGGSLFSNKSTRDYINLQPSTHTLNRPVDAEPWTLGPSRRNRLPSAPKIPHPGGPCSCRVQEFRDMRKHVPPRRALRRQRPEFHPMAHPEASSATRGRILLLQDPRSPHLGRALLPQGPRNQGHAEACPSAGSQNSTAPYDVPHLWYEQT